MIEKTWAISGVDLHLELKGTRVRRALEAALRDAVAGGRLRSGTRLPSSRSLAADLGLARNTVAEAYGQLVAEGWLTTRQGSGTRVAERAGERVVPPAAAPSDRPSVPRIRYDLRPGSPDLSLFPRSAWLAAARRALGAAPHRALGYSNPRGAEELRTELAAYLARARGVQADPDRIVISSGFTQAFWLLSQVLRRRGARTLAVERYLLQSTRRAAAENGLVLRALAVDEHGADIRGLGPADAVLLTPAHQFPLGMALSPERRAGIVKWALRGGGLIIEDDYDGEFRYDRHPLGALQALAPEQVVYVGTASKTLAPGVRLGWLVLPADLVDDVVAAKELADRHSSVIEQLTLARFILDGGYDRHIRRARLRYRRRRDHLVAALARAAPAVRVSGIAAGLHALAWLPRGRSEDDVVAAALGRRLALEGLGSYLEGEAGDPALVLGYATPPEHAFTAALSRLAAVLTSGRPSGPTARGRTTRHRIP